MEFSQVVLNFSRRDLRGADDLFWETRPVEEGIFFKSSCRLLGVDTVYATSLENSADGLFGVGVANFIFCRRVAFLVCVASAYLMCGAIFSGVSILGSGAVFGGCTCGDG